MNNHLLSTRYVYRKASEKAEGESKGNTREKSCSTEKGNYKLAAKVTTLKSICEEHIRYTV